MHKMKMAIVGMLLLAVANPAFARHGEAPYSLGTLAKLGAPAPEILLPSIDAEKLRDASDALLRGTGEVHEKRLAIAEDRAVDLGPRNEGRWQLTAEGSLVWRLRVRVAGATDLHLGFERYALAPGAKLWVIGANDYYEGPYTADDAGPLWIPMVPGDTATIELRLPAGTRIDEGQLELTSVGAGFRDLFKEAGRIGNPGASGACNINVVCPLGQPYAAEARALAYYEFRADGGGTYICTATLMNDVPGDRRNLVLTAAHCLSTPSEAASMRLYWNYQSTSCATNTGISFAQNQTGTTLRATRADADFTLVELNQDPDPAWNLYYAGWDATNIAPSGSIGLHHPRGDVAKVNNAPIAPRTTNNCIDTGGGSTNTHWYAGPYDQGTTEGGSSGSGLWIPAGDAGGRGKRLIGVLSGGSAACAGSVPDNGFDCYGKLSAGWDGASAATRLRDWLDPAGSGTLSIAGIESQPGTDAPDSVLATRIAADRQAVPLRNAGRGLGRHPPPFNPNLRSN
ncbi:MAG TPA: trypsin-like serine protease [Dokdonella sp.]|jgi:lysyl endopeptidase|nr:trypsin-like serine protease [Dokdonella sp.]